MNFHIDLGAFLQSLSIMGTGMLGVFLVTIVIVLVVTGLNIWTTPTHSDDDPT